MDTAPPDMRYKIWYRYIDNSYEVVHKDNLDELAKHLNTINKTGGIKFTDESEKDGSIPFMNACISRKDDSRVKVQVYPHRPIPELLLPPHTQPQAGSHPDPLRLI